MNVNPYEPMRQGHDQAASATSNIHNWRGHKVVVECHAVPMMLWMDNSFIVTVDDVTQHIQPWFHWGDTFRFTLQAGGRLVNASVSPSWGLFARRMKYQLIVDGERFAPSATSIRRWYLGVSAVVLGVPLLYAAFIAWI